jgi:hypothetical protein
MRIANNPHEWVLVAEESLGGAPGVEKRQAGLMAGSLFQTLGELGVPPDYVSRIASTIIRSAGEEKGHCDRSWSNLSIIIRFFCQPKLLSSLNHNQIEQDFESGRYKEIVPAYQTENITKAGWGYFLIERGRENPAASGGISHYEVDLFLYREGE